jgi:nucleotide-binding universal stress UspA family protein
MKVLLPLDGSKCSQHTVRWAVGFLDPARDRIYLLNVYDYTPEGHYRVPSLSESDTLLSQGKYLFQRQGFTVETQDSVLGTPGKTICAYAQEHGIDQIVMGSHGHQRLAKFLMGSVSEEVFRCFPGQVVILNNAERDDVDYTQAGELFDRPGPQRILLPVDGSTGSFKTLDWVAQHLDKSRSEIYLLMVVEYDPYVSTSLQGFEDADKILLNAQQELQHHGFQVKESRYLVNRNVAETICQFADKHRMDHIILGSQGRSAFNKWLFGSVSRAVFQTCRQNVLIVNTSEERELIRVNPTEGAVREPQRPPDL